MPLTVRTFGRSDLDQVMAIENDSFPDPYNRLTFRLLRRWVGEGFIVAEDGGVVGYAVAETQGARGHIISIAVSPKSRRLGVGAALLQELIRRMGPDVRGLFLEVRAGNRAAIRMYEEFSFEKTGEVRSRYYPDGEDAIVMVRELT
ncbi:MAG: ribosomal protein S18-alanine N-acetyltransferase [Nitrososphaerota archaeon]|nr:ribosomal protein S18-alanine N-acetyltransferase [Nitrososphaerota archaeon]MDG7024906.1 ribosomal protein S18-alanine N-acetyltransferase [Nitrososphaerota archaeon]